MKIKKVTPYSTTPSRENQEEQEFYQSMETRLSEENPKLEELNETIDGMNNAVDNVNTKHSDVVNKHVQVVNKVQNFLDLGKEVLAAKEAVENKALPTEAVDKQELRDLKDKNILDSIFNAYGYTKKFDVEERFEETNISYTLRDKQNDLVRFSTGLFPIENRDIIFPPSPFDPDGTDELLDDKLNGVRCQQAHEAGDIVVLGNELLDNRDFSNNNLYWHTGTGWNIENGQAVATNATSYLEQRALTVGRTYTVILEISELSQGSFRIYLGKSGAYSPLYTKAGIYTFTATATISHTFGIYAIGATGKIKKVSVKIKNNIYQAVTDTVVGDSVLNTSKFKKIDFVTRLDLFYVTQTGYKTKKGIHNFTDKELVEGGSDLIASRCGFTKLGNGLYEIDGEEAVALQVSGSRLNAGAYHPMFNGFGTKSSKMTNGDGDGFWHSSGSALDSSYTCFLNRTYGENIKGAYSQSGYIGDTGNQGRPDSKFYDKIYIKGENGLAPHSSFCAKDSEFESDRGLTGLSSGGATLGLTGETSTGHKCYYYANGTIRLYDDNFSTFGYSVGDSVDFGNLDSSYFMYAKNAIVKSITTTSILFEAPEYLFTNHPINSYNDTGTFFISKKHPLLLSYGESLTTDLVGSPDNYPTEWKSYLAAGGVTSVNPLLISDTGDSLIPEGTSKYFKWSKKVKEIGSSNAKYSVDNGATWADSSWDSAASLVDNGLTVVAVDGNLWIIPYTSYNTPYTQIDPTTITKVIPKVIASNSHSVYKGGLITQEATDKVPVGNGSNGYESRVLENAETGAELLPNTTFTALAYNFYQVPYNGSAEKYKGAIFQKSSSNGTTDWSVLDDSYWSNTTDWTLVNFSGFKTTPQHPTIQLDSSNSPASKWFEVELEFADGGKGEGVITQEIIFNKTDLDYSDDTGDFEQLTNCITTDLNGNNIKIKVLGRRY